MDLQVMRWTGAAWKYALTATTRDFAASKELDLGSSKDSAAPLGLHGQIQNPSMMGFFNGSQVARRDNFLPSWLDHVWLTQAIYVGDTSAVSTFSPATQFNVMKAAVRITNLEALDPQSKLVLNCTTLLSDLNSTDKGSLNARFAEWEIVSYKAYLPLDLLCVYPFFTCKVAICMQPWADRTQDKVIQGGKIQGRVV